MTWANRTIYRWMLVVDWDTHLSTLCAPHGKCEEVWFLRIASRFKSGKCGSVALNWLTNFPFHRVELHGSYDSVLLQFKVWSVTQVHSRTTHHIWITFPWLITIQNTRKSRHTYIIFRCVRLARYVIPVQKFRQQVTIWGPRRLCSW